MRNQSFEDRITSIHQALDILSLFADAEGVVKVEDKLGGARHEARLSSPKATKTTTPLDSAIQYVLDSPATVFAVNVTIMGTRGRAKFPKPDRMFIAFYTKDAILRGVRDFGPALTIHTNCVTFHKVGVMDMASTFGLPICAVECGFGLKDVQADRSRPTAPYAKWWETYISATFHGHNVANLHNSKYDMRIILVER